MLQATINGQRIDVTEQEYFALLRHEPGLFMERAFAELNPQTAYLPNWHIQKIAQVLEECRLGRKRRVIINLPPRSLKSHLASIAFPAWLLGHNPSEQIICVSYGQDLADTLGGQCRTLMSSAFYRNLFRTRLALRKQAVHDFFTTEQGFRMATFVGGVLTGRGADYLVIDDPLKPDEALSETQRNATNDWYKHTLLTRLNDKRTGRIIIIMQRLHEDDLVGHVLKLDDWEVLRFPAIAEQDETHEIRCFNKVRTITRRAGAALHPEREPLETLQKIKAAIGEGLFAGQYQQWPAPLEGGIVKRSWFKRYAPHELPAKFEMVFQSWDTANKAAEIHDYSVCTTWGVYQKHLFLLHVLRRRMEYPELKRTVLSHAQYHKAQRVLIEDNASGTQLLQDLKYEGFGRATAFKGEGDKQIRMFTATSTIENGFVLVPEIAEWAESYLYELTLFPNGRFDDQVDSTSQALGWYREHAAKSCYGVLEWAKQRLEPMGQSQAGPQVCSNCNKEMEQKIPGGLRCAHCGAQWSPVHNATMLSRNDALRKLGRT